MTQRGTSEGIDTTDLLSTATCPMCLGLNRTDDDSECPWCDIGTVEVDADGYATFSDQWGEYRMKLDNSVVRCHSHEPASHEP